MPTLDYPIRLPADLLEALGAFTGLFWSDSLGLEPFVCEAVRNYMQPAPSALAQPAAPSQAGYQWKQIFIPEGTRLRVSFRGQNYFARVEGEEIKHGGLAMSPSRFANLQGSGNRNAWKAIWLCFPGSDEWLLADVCRSARKAAIARLLGGAMEAARPMQQPQQKRDRRIAQRRTASDATGGKSAGSRQQPATRESAAGESAAGRRRTPQDGTGEAPVLPAGSKQRKSGAGRRNRHKRRPMKRLA